MKKLVILCAAIFTISSIMAQDTIRVKEKSPGKKERLTTEQRAQKAVDKMNETLTLSEDQKSKIYPLALERAKKSETIVANNGGKRTPENKETIKKELQAVNKEYRAAVKPILTQEQLDILKAKAKEKREAKKNKEKSESPNDDEIIPLTE